MKVWPFEAALRGEASNHHRLRQLNAVRGERCGKGAPEGRQVGIGKTNASESLLKCRYWIRWHQNWGETRVPWEEPGGGPLIGQAGVPRTLELGLCRRVQGMAVLCS